MRAYRRCPAAALVVVMFRHCALLLATIDTNGLRIGNLLGELPAIAPVTWVVQRHAAVLPRGPCRWRVRVACRHAVGDVAVHPRAATVRPVLLVSRCVDGRPVVARMVLGAESAEGLGRECVALLWFLGVYLVTLAFVPALTRMRTGRSVASVVASLLAAAAAVDGIRIARRYADVGCRRLRDRLVDPGRGRRGVRAPTDRPARGLARLSRRLCSPLLGRTSISLVVTGTEHMSNVSPPTLLLALHCTWMSCVFVAAAGLVRRWAARPRVWHVVAVGNGGAMTLYLWHIPAIAVATFALHAVGLDAYDVDAPGFWGLLALRAVVFAVVMAVAFWLLSPLEHRRLPWWDAPVHAVGARSTAAGALVCVAGVALVLLAKERPGWRRSAARCSGAFWLQQWQRG